MTSQLGMEENSIFSNESSPIVAIELKRDEDEDDFRSCCADEEELKESEEAKHVGSKNADMDEFSVKMFFKGVSITGTGNVESGFSGIGVFAERMAGVPLFQVQKRLDFYVDETVVNYLALMDGLSEVMQHDAKRVFAYTDSKTLYDQITCEEALENPFLMALRQRVSEHVINLEQFVLKCISDFDMEHALRLAQVAVGIVSCHSKGDKQVKTCSICCEEKLSPMMVRLKCSHSFCSHCMKAYVTEKVHSSELFIRCPQEKCRYYISTPEFESFLPISSYTSLERTLTETNLSFPSPDKFRCPFSNCSVLLDSHDCQLDKNCVECPACRRFVCVECGVPWHSSMSCEEFQELPIEERETGGVTLHGLAEDRRWRCCKQCQRTIELTHGCYHMTCWCGHEFCFSCGSEYREGEQTCQCAFYDEQGNSMGSGQADPGQQFEQWAWDSFGSLSTMMDAYSDQERARLALIQRFLARGFGLAEPCQSPPRCTDSYVDAMKDLHQLPWLERFVSVISDDYYDDEYTP